MIGHGGLLRVFSSARPIRGSGYIYMGDSSPDMLRRPETCISLCNLMLKLRGISHSSAMLGSDRPQSNNSKGNSIYPT